MLHVPRHKLEEFKEDKDPLAAVVDYWLRGNVEGVSVSWQSIVEALKSGYVGESGLAKRIAKKYCREENINDDGKSRLC